MAKLDHAKRNRLSRPVQKDSVKKMGVQGRWAKWDGQWVVGVSNVVGLPEDMIVQVVKSDGSGKPVRLLECVGSKELDFVTLNLYSFAQVDDSLPNRRY